MSLVLIDVAASRPREAVSAASPSGSRRVDPRRRSRWAVAAMAVVALAAGLALVVHGARTQANEPIVPAFADLVAIDGAHKQANEPIVPAFADSVEPTAGTGGVDAWRLSGDDPELYSMSLERDRSGRPVRSLRRSEGPGARGDATITQNFAATSYLGKRVRFSADVRTSGVDQGVGLWLRIEASTRSVAFDDMQRRPLHNTGAWTRLSVVLDVPESATEIAVGLVLQGSGVAALAGARVDVVGTDVPVSTTPIARP